MSDFGLYPFYVDRGSGFLALTEPPEFQHEFGLSDDVMRVLLDWDELYQAIYVKHDPRSSDWARPEDEQRYVECGRDAARLLRRHLPDDVRIRYLGADNIAPEYY
jgi:hypothetical protein